MKGKDNSKKLKVDGASDINTPNNLDEINSGDRVIDEIYQLLKEIRKQKEFLKKKGLL